MVLLTSMREDKDNGAVTATEFAVPARVNKYIYIYTYIYERHAIMSICDYYVIKCHFISIPTVDMSTHFNQGKVCATCKE